MDEHKAKPARPFPPPRRSNASLGPDSPSDVSDPIGRRFACENLGTQIVYDFALAILKQLIGAVEPALADQLRTGIARSIVAVANAAGDGFLGHGEKVSPEERACIRGINEALGLDQIEAGHWLMEQVGA